MPDRLRGFTTRRYINPLYLCLYPMQLTQLGPAAESREGVEADGEAEA